MFGDIVNLQLKTHGNIFNSRISARKGALCGSIDVYVSRHLGDGSVRADIILDCDDPDYEKNETASRQTG